MVENKKNLLSLMVSVDLESRWGQLVSVLQSGASAEDLNSGG